MQPMFIASVPRQLPIWWRKQNSSVRRKLKDFLWVYMKRGENEDGATCIGTPVWPHGHGVKTHSTSAFIMSTHGHACSMNKNEALEHGQCGKSIFKLIICWVSAPLTFHLPWTTIIITTLTTPGRLIRRGKSNKKARAGWRMWGRREDSLSRGGEVRLG